MSLNTAPWLEFENREEDEQALNPVIWAGFKESWVLRLKWGVGLGENPTKRYKSEALRVKHTGFCTIFAWNEKDWVFLWFFFWGFKGGGFWLKIGFSKGRVFGYWWSFKQWRRI
jgi:hypothetical protein